MWSEESYRNIKHVRLNVDSEFIWATPDKHGRVVLYDIYKINYTWPLTVTPAGHWDTTGLQYNITTFKYVRRENLQNLLFDTAIAVS